MRFRNVSPLGDLDVVIQHGDPADGPAQQSTYLVPEGEEVEVTGEQADRLAEQPEHWKRVDRPASRTKSSDKETD